MSLAVHSCRNLLHANRRLLRTTPFVKNNKPSIVKSNLYKSEPVRLGQTSLSRCFSNETNPDSNDNPGYKPLMDFPTIWMPALLRTFKCWLTFKLILPALDKEFKLSEFIEGAQHAVCFVSNALSREDYDSLDGLVTPEAIETLKMNLSKLNHFQKSRVALEKKECHIYFPYDVNVRKGTNGSTNIVEIVMVFHFLRNWKNPQDISKVLDTPSTMERMQYMNETMADPDYPYHTTICNYRFIREYGDTEKSWLIDIVNQFKLADIL